MAKRSAPRTRRSAGSSRQTFREPPALRLALGCLAALVLVAPLVVVPTARDSFSLPKLLISEWLALASIAALALNSCLLSPASPFSWRSVTQWPALRAVAPLVAVAMASLLVSDHPATTREALISLWIGAAALVAWSLYGSALRLRRLLDLSLAPAVILAVLGILQAHGVFQPFGLESTQGDRLQATSLTGNVGVLGGFLVLPLLLLLERALQVRDPRARRSGWTHPATLASIAVVLFYGLFASQTMTAFLALATGGLALALVHIGRRARLAVVVSLVLAIVALSIAGPLASARAAEKRDQILRGEWNIALSYRGDAWLAAIDILQRNPLLGTGHGTFKSEFAEARLRRVEAGQPVSRANVNPHFANTHNDYLEVGAELGLIGLAALAWGLSELVRAVARAGPDRALAAAGSSAIAVLALGYFPFETPLLAYPAILFLAWVFSRSPASGTAEAAAA